MIHLRRATEADAGTLCDLATRTFRETYEKQNTPENMRDYVDAHFSPELQCQEILAPENRVIVAELGGDLIGYYMLTAGSPTANGHQPTLSQQITVDQPAIEIRRFYVESKLHGSRLSHTMMQHAITLARGEGFKTLWLGVWEKNERAIAFYKKWLFKPIGEHIFMLGDDPQRDLLLAHWL